MRKLNGILSGLILLLFIVHAVLGAFNLIGVSGTVIKAIAVTMMALICVHTVFGCILTARSVKVWKKSGTPYFKENMLFWARRLSGLLIMILMIFHAMMLSANTDGGGLRLAYFGEIQMITQLFFVIAVGLHVITNVKPMLISFGIRKLRPKAGDIIFWISAVLLLSAAGFIIYYLRWNMV